jgi:hypothetical protein
MRAGILGRVVVRLLAGALAAAAVALAGAAWLVATGPLSVAFLTPYFEQDLTFESGLAAEFDDVVLAWGGWRRNVDLRVVGVRIVDVAAQTVATAPAVSVTLSAGALLRGLVRPTEVELYRPEFQFMRTADGRLTFGGLGGGEGDAGIVVQSLLAVLAAPADSHSLTGLLERVAVSGGAVRLHDDATGTVWVAPNVDAQLDRQASGVSGDLDIQLLIGGHTVRLAAAAEYAASSGSLTLAAAFNGVNPAALSGGSTALAHFGAVDMPVSGTVSAQFRPNGTVTRVDYDLSGGAGVVRVPELWREPQPVDLIAVRGSVVDDFQTVRFEELFVSLGDSHGEATGFVTFAPEGVGLSIDASWRNVSAANLPQTWPLGLAPRSRAWVTTRVHEALITEGRLRMRVAPGRFLALPLVGDEVQMTFSYTGARATVLDGQPPLEELSGTAVLTAAAFHATMEAGRIGDLSITEGALHIDGLEAQAPSAVIDVVAAGPVQEMARLFRLPPLNIEGIPEGLGGNVAARAKFTMPIREVLLLEDVKFAAAANVRQLSLVEVPGGRSLSQGEFSVRADATGIDAQGGVSLGGVPLKVDLRHAFDGRATPTTLTASGVLDRFARETFGLTTGELLSGPVPFTAYVSADGWSVRQMDIDLDLTPATLRLPLAPWDKEPGEIAMSRVRLLPVEGDVLEVPGFSISTPALSVAGNLSVTPALGTASGRVTLNGAEAAIDWMASGAGDDDASHLAITGIANEAIRSEFGIPPQWIIGPVAVTADIVMEGLRARSAVVSLDLRDAAVTVPGWSKDAGTDGVAEVNFAPDAAGRFRVHSFAASAVDLTGAGTIEYGTDGALRQFNVARLVLGETNLAGTVVHDNGGYRVAVSGSRLDSRPLFERAAQLVADDALPPLTIDARFNEVVLPEGHTLAALHLIAVASNEEWERVDATAIVPGGSGAFLVVERHGEGYAVSLTADDAGALFRALGIFGDAEGGTLSLSAESTGLPGARTVAGTVNVESFHVLDAPALAQILSLASLSGLNDALLGAGIAFEEFEAPFVYRSGLVELGQSRAFGPGLGITIEGEFSPGARSINVAGTLVPAYTINRVLGAIPVLGELLVGEGVFAIAYKVTGDSEQPTIIVNPLSVIMPGFLRGILFGFRAVGETVEAPPEPPPGDAGPGG